MKFPFYKQADLMDCGPTCLRMVAKKYGRNISVQTLRERSQIGKEGVNLLGIGEAAESIKFRTSAIKLSYKDLINEIRFPAILHWGQNHFVVLFGVKKKKLFSRKKEEKIYIADPAKGLMVYSAEEFKNFWVSDKEQGEPQGVALLLEPTPDFYNEPDSSTGETKKESSALRINDLFNYIRPYKKLVGQLFIGLTVGSLLQLILPFLTQSVVDTGIGTSNMHFIYIVLLAQLSLFAGRLAVEFVRGWILLHISTRINLSILTDFLIKLMKLPVSFFDSKHTGDILQRMSDHKRIESFLTGSSLNVLFSLINLVIFSIVLVIFNIQIFFVFIFASCVYAIWVILFLKKRRILDYKRFDIAAKEQSATIQLIQGMQEIRLNEAERPMRWNWERLQVKLFGLSMKSLSLTQWQQAGAFFINEGKNIFITFLSARAVIDGDMTLGAMLAVQYIIGQLNSPIEQVVSFAQSWQNARISIERLNEIHGLDDEEPDSHQLHQELPPAFARKLAGGRRAEAQPERILDEDGLYAVAQQSSILANSDAVQYREQVEAHDVIELRNVTFTYSGAGNEPVLRNINLRIKRGETTAIVGTSGSGKTTLLKLLLKFYQPQEGEIRLGETPLHNISHRVWRRHCGVVMQESFIFSDTIARNIAVGQEKIDISRLHYAAEVANVRSFIESLPLGFNTKIGAEGTGISMGQKQRILIARSVYRDPDFIFFDEATNSLDANNESIIVQNLESFLKQKTVIVVAHRLSTVRHADQIVVINQGRISERGTHQELTNLRGEYFKLVKNQLELGT